MGYIFNLNDARAYEAWLNKPKNKCAAELESRLMFNMLKPIRGDSVLDIGCGTGLSLIPFLKTRLSLTGLEPSQELIDIASDSLGYRADIHQGVAEDLPFEDNAFNHACLIRTLEFVEDPQKALEEACRVAKNTVFIGILNRHSLKGAGLRVQRIFTKTVYDHARFFSIWELKEMIRGILGDVPIYWGTVCQFSKGSGNISYQIECSEVVQKCPFGAFTGIAVILVPRFRTRPLELIPQTKGACSALAGLARTKELE
jgi:SAM-dependent methyltransferase